MPLSWRLSGHENERQGLRLYFSIPMGVSKPWEEGKSRGKNILHTRFFLGGSRCQGRYPNESLMYLRADRVPLMRAKAQGHGLSSGGKRAGGDGRRRIVSNRDGMDPLGVEKS